MSVTEDRCPLCGARYDDLRTGLGDAGEYLSAAIAAAGRDKSTSGSGDGTHLTLAWARRQLGEVKRALWSELHGPGVCAEHDDPRERFLAILPDPDLAFDYLCDLLGPDDAPSIGEAASPF